MSFSLFFVVGNNGNIGNNDFSPKNLSTIDALFIILDVRPFHFSYFNFCHISFLLPVPFHSKTDWFQNQKYELLSLSLFSLSSCSEF